MAKKLQWTVTRAEMQILETEVAAKFHRTKPFGTTLTVRDAALHEMSIKKLNLVVENSGLSWKTRNLISDIRTPATCDLIFGDHVFNFVVVASWTHDRIAFNKRYFELVSENEPFVMFVRGFDIDEHVVRIQVMCFGKFDSETLFDPDVTVHREGKTPEDAFFTTWPSQVLDLPKFLEATDFVPETVIESVKRPLKEKKPTGCEACPLNEVPGINKIMGEVTGKDIMIWAQSPGPEENSAKPPRELVGRSGRWLWNELGRVGIKREDCDIQNVVRCIPADRMIGGLYMRDPNKQELKCCQVHNKAAIAQQTAKVWLVFGKIAAVQLFGKSQSNHRIFYEDDRQVFILDHPSYFIRGATKDRLDRFRKTLDIAKLALQRDRFWYMDRLPVEIITTGAAAVRAAKEIIKISTERKMRVAYDEEDDVIDGERKLLCMGACPHPSVIKCFVVDHPENKASAADKEIVRKVVQGLMRHPHQKVLQHGCHDAKTVKELLDVEMKGFEWDTNYGDYMFDPSHQSYSLTNIVNRRYPTFTDYKEYVIEAVPEGLTVEEGRDIGDFHLARVPLEKMARYNAMDCLVTKKIEIDVQKHVPTPLVRVYTDASFILDDMEHYGPLYDEQQAARLMEIYPSQKAWYAKEIQRLANNPDLNLNSPKQMQTVLYETWRLKPLNSKMSTDKETLAVLRQRYKHKGLEFLDSYRGVKNKIERIESFDRSAKAHLGRVATIWWLTGTVTGRLSSGGGTRPDKRNLGNLQNIPREDSVMNMLISDLLWRDFYKRATIQMKETTDENGKLIWTVDDKALDKALTKYEDMEWFVAMDYSQMELRVLALVSGELKMLELFNSGVDIHAAIGTLWSGWAYDQLFDTGNGRFDEMKRTIVKRLHFGIIYGLTPPGLKDDLLSYGIRVSDTTAAGYYNQYFSRFNKVKQYIADMPEFARRYGYVKNLFGFKVPITVPTDDYAPRGEGSFWKNQAVNAPIQGAAHQVMLCALALLKRNREKYALIRPQMEIHDALVGVTPGKYLVETIQVQKQLMEQDVLAMIKTEFGVNWSIPLVAEPKLGFRFGGLAKVKDDVRKSMKKAVELVPKQEAELQKLYEEYCLV